MFPPHRAEMLAPLGALQNHEIRLLPDQAGQTDRSVLWNLLSYLFPEGKPGWLWALPKGLLDCGYL